MNLCSRIISAVLSLLLQLLQAPVAAGKEGSWKAPYDWAGFVLEGEWK